MFSFSISSIPIHIALARFNFTNISSPKNSSKIEVTIKPNDFTSTLRTYETYYYKTPQIENFSIFVSRLKKKKFQHVGKLTRHVTRHTPCHRHKGRINAKGTDTITRTSERAAALRGRGRTVIKIYYRLVSAIANNRVCGRVMKM